MPMIVQLCRIYAFHFTCVNNLTVSIQMLHTNKVFSHLITALLIFPSKNMRPYNKCVV